jgi:hypothetical protein
MNEDGHRMTKKRCRKEKMNNEEMRKTKPDHARQAGERTSHIDSVSSCCRSAYICMYVVLLFLTRFTSACLLFRFTASLLYFPSSYDKCRMKLCSMFEHEFLRFPLLASRPLLVNDVIVQHRMSVFFAHEPMARVSALL